MPLAKSKLLVPKSVQLDCQAEFNTTRVSEHEKENKVETQRFTRINREGSRYESLMVIAISAYPSIVI